MSAPTPASQITSLLLMIGCPLFPGDVIDPIEDESLYRLAVRNKIQLLYLERLAERGKLDILQSAYAEECQRSALTRQALVRASSALSQAGISHVVFKTLKPFPYVPGDVDILTLGGDSAYLEAIESLLRLGFQPVVDGFKEAGRDAPGRDLSREASRLAQPTHGVKHVSPTGVDFVDPLSGVDIDLQKQFGMSHLVFINPSTLIRTVRSMEDGTEVPVLPPEQDFGIVVVHSLMEQLFLLSEFYSLAYYLSSADDDSPAGSLVDFLDRNNASQSLREFALISAVLARSTYGSVPPQISYLLERLQVSPEQAQLKPGSIRMPHRYNVKSVLRLLAEKVADPAFRTSLVTQLVRMIDPRLTIQVLRHLWWYRRRRTYMKTQGQPEVRGQGK